MFKSQPVLICFLIIFLLLAVPLLAESHAEIQEIIQFNQNEIAFDHLMGYDLVSMADCGVLDVAGKPMLPAKEIWVAVPPGMRASGVRVIDAKGVQLSGEYNIFPAQLPKRTGSTNDNMQFIDPDPMIYSSSSPYPAENIKLIGQSDLAGQGVANILVYPLRYIPEEKKLIFYQSLTLVIHCDPGYECSDYLHSIASEKIKDEHRRMLTGMVINPQDVQLMTSETFSKSRQLPEGPFDHVIVTDQYFEDAMQPLAEWHTKKGVKDTVVTVNWIEANISGADKKEKIRNFISDAYSDWGIGYVLLIGESGYVPFEYRTYYNENTPSDQYYSDFDDDWINEVALGRVTIGSVTAANRFINKIMKYEKDPPRSDYILDAILLGMDLDASTYCEMLKENITGYVPTRFNFTKIYDSQASNHRTDFLDALNAGHHLVNHADHSFIATLGTGDFHHGWGIYNSDVNNLTNDGELSVIVSNGCDPNRMDYGPYDCIAEHFVVENDNRAGISFTGNTRSGLYYQGQPLSLSNELDRRWWIALFVNNEYKLGRTLINCKHQFNHSISQGAKHSEWTFNLLGEPEMPIWTDDPDSFLVTCPSTAKINPEPFEINVKDFTTSANLNQAYVCLWKPNEVYLTGYTDADGNVTFMPDPDNEGIMYVTVTDQNYLPYEHEVEVIGYICGDATGDEAVNVSDAVHIINYIFAGGPAPDPMEAGDVNCIDDVNVSDAVFIINFIFAGGSDPCDPDDDGVPDC